MKRYIYLVCLGARIKGNLSLFLMSSHLLIRTSYLIWFFVAFTDLTKGQDISRLYDRVKDGVVTLECTTSTPGESSLGTGFFISEDGIFITNYHVIKGARKIVVTTPSGNSTSDVLIGQFDETRDLAILKASITSKVFLKFKNSNSNKIGQRVIAIGNPQGLSYTLSEGIISGVRHSKDSSYEYIQTTTPISPGSSGGPLLSLSGEVIGVTTFQLIRGQNLNFAVPVGTFIKNIEKINWLTISHWRKSLVQPEVTKLMVTARSKYEQNENESAKHSLYSLLEKDTSNTEALLLLARIFTREWDNINTIKVLTRFVKIDSTNAESYFLLGAANDKLGNTKMAIKSYEYSLLLDSSNAKPYYELALLYRTNGDIEKAQYHVNCLRMKDTVLYRYYNKHFAE